MNNEVAIELMLFSASMEQGRYRGQTDGTSTKAGVEVECGLGLSWLSGG